MYWSSRGISTPPPHFFGNSKIVKASLMQNSVFWNLSVWSPDKRQIFLKMLSKSAKQYFCFVLKGTIYKASCTYLTEIINCFLSQYVSLHSGKLENLACTPIVIHIFILICIYLNICCLACITGSQGQLKKLYKTI